VLRSINISLHNNPLFLSGQINQFSYIRDGLSLIEDIDEKTKIEKYNIVFDKINEIRGPNYVALQGIFFVYDSKKNIVTKLKPENRFYPIENNFTTEASIHTNLFRDLYIVLGEGNSNDGWVVRIYYNPLVIWIWIGALVIFLGGITSININLKKLKILS